MDNIQTVFVTGSGGYIGSVLTPRLIKASYRVKAYDLFWYGQDVLRQHPNLEVIRGDVRDTELLKKVLPGCDAVIHLACVSNDPDFNLNKEVSKQINYDAFGPLVDIAIDSGVRRFVYASSSSVYGVKLDSRVTEDLKLEPITDYAKYKGLCEEVLFAKRCPGFTALALRPATISGYSPRFRMDVVVNALTLQALARRRITVHGGEQMRANLFMQDMIECYLQSLQWPAHLVNGQVFNVGQENYHVIDLAQEIRAFVGRDVEIVIEPTHDSRSYSLCSDKIRRVVGFVPRYHLDDALYDLQAAWQQGKIEDPLNNPRYYNVKWLKKVGLK